MTGPARSLADRLVARLRAVGCVHAEAEATALLDTFASGAGLDEAVTRREAGEPLEHVLGYVDFCGLRMAIGPGVFVPRVRAAALARLGAAATLERGDDTVAVDVGCGSGALAAVVADQASGARVLAVDADLEAVNCAAVNARTWPFEVRQGDWLSALPDELRGRVDVVVAYLPHVPSDRLTWLPQDALAAEGPATVDGGADGLDPLRQVLDQLDEWLTADGVLVTLIAPHQLDAAVAIAVGAGWSTASTIEDDDVLLTIGAR